jgi:hypothetical protein
MMQDSIGNLLTNDISALNLIILLIILTMLIKKK